MVLYLSQNSTSLHMFFIFQIIYFSVHLIFLIFFLLLLLLSLEISDFPGVIPLCLVMPFFFLQIVCTVFDGTLCVVEEPMGSRSLHHMHCFSLFTPPLEPCTWKQRFPDSDFLNCGRVPTAPIPRKEQKRRAHSDGLGPGLSFRFLSMRYTLRKSFRLPSCIDASRSGERINSQGHRSLVLLEK